MPEIGATVIIVNGIIIVRLPWIDKRSIKQTEANNNRRYD